ncbi:MAG: 2Fe-2S iron-sulfur cluster-binding protein [Acidiferrobacterales bacterium]|nr:2Fe-2S iron-sulfur cluster-binding protein [Acidiferrobacterales bacterium]
MKRRAKQLGIDDVRVNNSGCLERCELGPTMVIYPDGVWYHYESESDIDEILDSHIVHGQPVSRLMLRDGQKFPDSVGFQRLKLKVSSIEPTTEDTLRIELQGEQGRELPEFIAGSHIDLIVGAGDERRSYSMINDPSERHRYVIGVLRDSNSRGGSEWIHETVRPGASIESGYPKNNFSLNESAPYHLLIAGGIGVAPILSMCHRLNSIGAAYEVHYCERNRLEAAFIDEIQNVARDCLTVHYDDGDPQQGIPLEDVLSKRPEGAHLYICGPSQLMADARSAAKTWPDDSVHTEKFRQAPSDDWVNSEFEVVLARRQTTIRVMQDQSILDALRAQDITTDFSCTEGLCGTCRTKVLFGNVEHRDSVLTETEKSHDSLMMVCISRAAAGEDRLILDI